MGFENGDIPESVLIEILIRLSTKVVHRFKIVSKQWLSLISNPSFVRRYVSRASSLSQPWTFITHYMYRERSILFYFPKYELLEDIYSQVTKPSYCVLPCTHQLDLGEWYFRICGVSSGLVLYDTRGLSADEVLSHYICNPVTRQWIALPKFKWRFLEESCSLLTHVEDGILKSYRVVRLEYLRRRKKYLRFDVFFSEIGKWKKFIVPINLEKQQCFRSEPTAINGVLYWIVSRLGIIAYDPDQSPKHVHTIAFPVDTMDPHIPLTLYSICGAYEGKLRYFEVCLSRNQETSFKVWVLNDHISGDWSLQHKVGYMDIQSDANLSVKMSIFTPLCFHPFDLDVVCFGWGDALVSYNMETKRLEVVQEKCSKSEKTPKEKPDWFSAFLLATASWPTSLRRFMG